MRLQHRPLAFRRSRNRLVSDIHVPGAASGISLGVAISGRLCSQAKASLRRMGVVVARTSVTLGVLAEGGMRVSETADRRICQAAEMAERSSSATFLFELSVSRSTSFVAIGAGAHLLWPARTTLSSLFPCPAGQQG